MADFTPEQVNAIVEAYITNGQIYRILDDRDVRDFLFEAVLNRIPDLEPKIVPRLLDVLDDYTADDSPLRWLRSEIGLTWYGPGGEIPESARQ